MKVNISFLKHSVINFDYKYVTNRLTSQNNFSNKITNRVTIYLSNIVNWSLGFAWLTLCSERRNNI